MSLVAKKAKEEFLKMVSDFGDDPWGLLSHVPEAERWAKFALKKYPEIDEEVLLLAVWLHDIGHYPIAKEVDHSVRGGEELAREFLEKENYPEDKSLEVLHCVRSHRNGDVKPKSLEAKIMAAIDSASHATTSLYFDVARDDKRDDVEFRVYGKIERDMRDLVDFPEIQNKLKDIFEDWKKLLRSYEKIDF